MPELVIKDVSEDLVSEFSAFCVPTEKRENPIFKKGILLKEIWALENLMSGQKFGKVAFWEGKIAGIIQFKTFQDEEVLKISCLFVPHREHWGKGIASSLLNSLIVEAKILGKGNDGTIPSFIIVRPFPGEMEGQLSMREFFLKRGFRPSDDDPGLLIYTLKDGFQLKGEREPPSYRVQDEDLDKVLILFGPSFCPWEFFFLKRVEGIIKKEAHQIPIRWINRAEEPGEFGKRGGFEGVVVLGNPMKAYAGDEKEFSQELKHKLILPNKSPEGEF